MNTRKIMRITSAVTLAILSVPILFAQSKPSSTPLFRPDQMDTIL